LTLDAICAFAARHLPEQRRLVLDDSERRLDVTRSMCEELSVHLLFLPEELGGMGAASLDIYRVCETMAGIDLGVTTSVLARAVGPEPFVAHSLGSLMMAACVLGAGWAALDRAILSSKERVQDGVPLSRRQGFTHQLIVPHVTRLEAASAYSEETAERFDAGEGSLAREGTIARYLACEAGDAAAEAAIRAHGGYGHTRGDLVEKMQRGVSIAEDHGRQHLEISAAHAHVQAQDMEALAAVSPGIGAEVAALAHHALTAILGTAALRCSPLGEHALCQLGDLVATADSASALCRRAARAATGELSPKAGRRLDADGLATLSRLSARAAALKVNTGGLALFGAVPTDLRLVDIGAAQSGGVDDTDRAADAIYRSACHRLKHHR
jgi:hypothetical protein